MLITLDIVIYIFWIYFCILQSNIVFYNSAVALRIGKCCIISYFNPAVDLQISNTDINM